MNDLTLNPNKLVKTLKYIKSLNSYNRVKILSQLSNYNSMLCVEITIKQPLT